MTAKSAAYHLAQWLSLTLPSSVSFGLAQRLADLQWRCSVQDRSAVHANLEMVLGTALPQDAPLVREVFRNFARYLVEFFALHRVPRPDVTVDGSEFLSQAHRAGRGVIVLTAHLGNWEAGAVLIHRMGFPVSAVALPHGDSGLDRLFNAQRQRCGIEVIPLGRDAAARSLRSLQAGHVLGILGDRVFAGDGLQVTCYGRQLLLPRGPALLSTRSQAPVVPASLVREGMWKFRLLCEQPIWPTGRVAAMEALHALTQRYATAMERHLKRWPGQWLMFERVG